MQVEATRVHVLLEVDTLATVKCFAFTLQDGAEATMEGSVPTQECRLQSFQPSLFTVTGLSPGTAYVLHFLGIRKTDRERCVAVVTTKYRVPASDVEFKSLPVCSGWRIRLLNHRVSGGKQWRALRSFEAQVYQKVARDNYQPQKLILTIHHGIFLSPQKVSAMLEILEHGTVSGTP